MIKEQFNFKGNKMGVYSRNGKLWINFVYKGVRCFESLKLQDTKQNRKYAERLLAEIKNKIALDTFNYQEYFPESKRLKIFGYNKKVKIKFSKIAIEWSELIQNKMNVKMIKYSTYPSYMTGFKIIQSSDFYDKYIDEINKADIEDFVISLYSKYKNKTIVNILTPLRRIFDYALDKNYIEFNVMDRIKNPKIVKPEIHPFTKDEVILILDYFKKEYKKIYPLIAVGFFTGMRIGEILAMKWCNLDTIKWIYRVKESYTDRRLGTPKTINSIRDIPIIEPLQEILQDHKKYTFMKSEFIFINQYNKPYTSSFSITTNYWKPALKELGIIYRPMYQMRHTHAILSLVAGDNPHDVAKRLGHSSLQMLFQRYGKYINGMLNKSKLSDYLKNENSDEKCYNNVTIKKINFQSS